MLMSIQFQTRASEEFLSCHTSPNSIIVNAKDILFVLPGNKYPGYIANSNSYIYIYIYIYTYIVKTNNKNIVLMSAIFSSTHIGYTIWLEALIFSCQHKHYFV